MAKKQKLNTNSDITELSYKLDVANEIIKDQEAVIEKQNKEIKSFKKVCVRFVENAKILNKTIENQEKEIYDKQLKNNSLRDEIEKKDKEIYNLKDEIDNLKNPQIKKEHNPIESVMQNGINFVEFVDGNPYRMNDIELIDYLLEKKTAIRVKDISVNDNDIESPIYSLITSDVLVEVLKDTGRDFTISTDEPKITFSRKTNKDD